MMAEGQASITLDREIFILILSCVRGGSAVSHEWTHLNWLRTAVPQRNTLSERLL